MGNIQFLDGDLLFTDTGDVAMDPDCCCGGPCTDCDDEIQGILLDVSGVGQHDPPTDCACYDTEWTCCACTAANDTFFIPWDSSFPLDACDSSKTWYGDDNGECCNEDLHPDHYQWNAGYSINFAGPFPDGKWHLQILYSLQVFADTASITVSGSCYIPFDTGDLPTCSGQSCIDTSPNVTSLCDATGAEVECTIV